MSAAETRRARTVWKYRISVQDDPVNVTMPMDSELVHVAGVIGDPTAIEVWALVDPEPSAPKWVRTFVVRGTGHPVPDGVAHRGTVIDRTYPTPLVWHLFEVIA